MSQGAREEFRSIIAAHLGCEPDRVALFSRGRVALYALLRALDVRPGDEVVVPAYTCVAVPNAIIYAGATPVWADIDPRTLTLDPASAEAVTTPRTRVILAQNTFGLSADLEALGTVADRVGATVIDDCTHGLGGTYRGTRNGTASPLAFFSTQWSKPVSTGLGGFAVDLAGMLGTRLRALEQEAAEPSRASTAALTVLVRGRALAGNGRALQAGRTAYRALSRAGLVPASSGADELAGVAMPDGFLSRLSAAQARRGVAGLTRLEQDVAARQRLARGYSAWLLANGRTPAAEPPDREHAFLRYPLRTTERDRVARGAARLGVDLGDWFVSPLHPVRTGLDRWAYVAGTAPRAEQACREVVNLPTNPTMSDAAVERVHRLLEEHSEALR